MPSRTAATVALALCLVLAGCLGTIPGGDDDAARTGTPSPFEPGSAPCSVPEPVSPTPTTRPGTPSPTGDLPGGLAITSDYEGNLTVVLRRLPQNVTTFAERYSGGSASVDLGPEMADKSNYWTVVLADCEVVWSREVPAYREQGISIGPDGEVSVDWVAEA